MKLNNKQVKIAFLDSDVIYDDGSLTVRGYDSDGTMWVQAESGAELTEPYLNSYGYKITLSECTAENHNAPVAVYRWFYRCFSENFDVVKRTILSKGVADVYTPLNYIDEAGNSVLAFPLKQFSSVSIEYAFKVLWRVINDNHFIAFPYANAEKVRFAESKAEYEQMLNTVNATITSIDAKIAELYGFTPTNRPQSVEDKVKVAKVIFDWLRLNNQYNNTADWKDQTIYNALSGGIGSPICASYGRAAHLLLDRYGIENIVCNVSYNGIGHICLIVNYHDEIGTYTADSSQWCIFDATGNEAGTISSWKNFNNTNDSRYEFNEDTYPLPTTKPMDGEHTYSGSKHYDW